MARRVVVFGGTGFLGRRVVRHLVDHGFVVRIASRQPERNEATFPDRTSQIEPVRADISEDRSVTEALNNVFGVVNAVSLYAERDGPTFHSVHVDAAERLARRAHEAGVSRLVHVSGIGADATSPSPYIRSRGEGENAVRAAFPPATIVRPAVMFGPDDAFLTSLIGILRRLPAFPLFGDGRTRLQPAYVEDVGEAIARIVKAAAPEPTYELGGPRTYTYEELLRTICERLGLRRALVPVPFALWQAVAHSAEFLPRPPIARTQVELMKADNIASRAHPGFAALGIEPRCIETILPAR